MAFGGRRWRRCPRVNLRCRCAIWGEQPAVLLEELGVGVADIPHEMEQIGDLKRAWRSLSSAVGIGAGAIAHQDLAPGRELIGSTHYTTEDVERHAVLHRRA